MLTITSQPLADIPALILRDTRFDRAPALIFYHGWGGSKGGADSPDPTLVKLAESGVVVVCPDAYEHGERQTAAQFRKTFNGWAFICDAMDKSREESCDIIEATLALPYVAPENLQVAGISMGGLIAQMVYDEHLRIERMGSILGRSSFVQADPWCREAQRGTWCDEWCENHAPHLHAERFTRGPVLFIDGGLDDDCPADINAETVARINASGGRAHQFVDPDAGHEFTPAMRDAFVRFVTLQD